MRWKGGITKIGFPPRRLRAVSGETTDAKIKGPKLSIAIEPRTISATNNAPAIGALYAAAMPAAPPQATMSRRRGVVNFALRPTSEASHAPSCDIEPSRPMEPPDAIERSDEMLFTK